LVLAATLFLSLEFDPITTPVLVEKATSSQSLDPPRTGECDSAVLVYMKQCLDSEGWVGIKKKAKTSELSQLAVLLHARFLDLAKSLITIILKKAHMPLSRLAIVLKQIQTPDSRLQS